MRSLWSANVWKIYVFNITTDITLQKTYAVKVLRSGIIWRSTSPLKMKLKAIQEVKLASVSAVVA